MASFYDLIFRPILKDARDTILTLSDISKGDSVLEVACGTGEQAVLYAKNGAIVTGLDISQEMLNIAEKKRRDDLSNLSLNFMQGDASNLPFESDKFDIISITLALHEMDPDIRSKVIKEMLRVTKKQGKIIIADYAVPEKMVFKSYLCRSIDWVIEFFAGKEHYRNYMEFMANGGIYRFVKKHSLKIEQSCSQFSNTFSILVIRK